jgi:DNA helicase II / ATP-dependent DNA helicase PcrA
MPNNQNLNSEQQRAVETTEGPLLILAGAGSGKTKTLTHRIAHILETNKATPYEILAVTFTNKAAKEMRERVSKLLGSNSTDRSFMPYMGTFHGICVRLLRQDGDYIGIPDNFVIYDESDRQTLVKRLSKQLQVDDKQHPARAIIAAISSAKNEMLTPTEYSQTAQSPTQKIAAQIYPLYEQALKSNSALDFDDLILKMVNLLENQESIRSKWQQRFKYILIDEYQDTNAAQYRLIKLLTNENRNICVVGDDWQCLIEGHVVQTETGEKNIEDIKVGDKVKAAAGYGSVGKFRVLSNKVSKYNGEIINITTRSGRVLKCTPNHVLFSRLGISSNFFVYLMYSSKKGYRIGVTRGTRFDGKKYDTGLRVRANQERAERVWILKVESNLQEALYQENYLAYKYGIPTVVFETKSLSPDKLKQPFVDKLYKNINTQERAKDLMVDYSINFDFPHFIPQATTRGDIARVNVNVVLFGDKRQTINSPWSASRISANTTDIYKIDFFKKAGYALRTAKSGTFRSEIHNLDYGHIESKLQELARSSPTDYTVAKYAYLTDIKYNFMPASQLHAGMHLAGYGKDNIVDDEIINIKKTHYTGNVYDLDVDKVHNYIGGGVVVHNSIYSWRGADFTNILNFERDYKKATIIRLEQNYRSTQPILNAAHNVIAKNSQRSKKELWTDKKTGDEVKIISAFNERHEAEMIIRLINTQVDMGLRNCKDFAVLYRTNSQSRSLEEQFIRYGLPYKIVGGTRFYDRAEIKDILAYIRLLHQPQDTVSFRRISNVPGRGFGEISLNKFLQWQEQGGLSLTDALEKVDESPLSTKAKATLKQLNEILQTLRQESAEVPVAVILDILIKKIKYFEHLDDGSLQGESRIENVKELLSVAKAYSEVGLSSFLEEVALISDIDTLDESADAVTLMTMHAAKGLEFPVVFISGMEESIFPHSRALFDQNQMEEERRLCYVAMTRAMQELYLCHADSRVLFGGVQHNPPSRFVSEVNAEYLNTLNLNNITGSTDSLIKTVANDEPRYVPELEPGDVVRHQVFGIGTVIETDGDVAAVNFKGRGVKRLNVSFAPLEKVT